MLANILMLTLALGTLLVPVYWMTRPLRTGQSLFTVRPPAHVSPALTEATL